MTAITHELVTIVGEVTAWRVVREGWGFGQLRPTDATIATVATVADVVAFTGTVLARVGDTVELAGVWTEHATYGRQLKVRACTVARPESPDGVVAWLVSSLPNIGESRARALVARWPGAELWAVIESDPGRLTEVDGITAARVEVIVTAYQTHRAERDYMVRLRGWGLTDAQIGRCREAWGALGSVVDHVHANPYDLAQCVPGFGFVRADRVATRAGVPHDAPARVLAGVVHVLDTAVGAGDCFLWGRELQRRAAKLLEVAPGLVADGIRAACAERRVVGTRARYYVPRIDVAEASCAGGLAGLIDRGCDVPVAAANRNDNVVDLAAARRRAVK